MTTISARAARHAARNEVAPWRHVDLTLITATIAIAAFGVVMVFSATQHKLEDAGVNKYQMAQRQAMYVVIGIAVMVVVALIDYRHYRDRAPLLYAGALVVLLAVLSPLGSTSKGAQAWFQLGGFQFEPSEVAKVALIVCVATYCAQHREGFSLRHLLTVLVLSAVPMGLIYLQPDLGTALVFVAILMAMLLVAGVRPRHIAVLTLIGVIGIVGVIKGGVLKQYQLDRLGAFLDPAGDTQRTTYNLAQSKIAIGSGGVRGKGLFQGTQTNLSYVPEQHTDFIFTVVGEELGLVGSVALLGLFAIVMWRTWRTAVIARDDVGRLICVGVLAMLVFQVFENVGMTMGIMPITGIPLPLVSFGGSATIATFAGIGLVLNVHMRRYA